MIDQNPIIILAGPTASGKSALALAVADALNAVIINCDAMQIYTEIPIITAQPTIEEKIRIPHELYGTVSASINGSVSYWLSIVVPVIERVLAQGKVPLLVGGTGMYIKALTEGISPIPEIEEGIRKQVRQQWENLGKEDFFALLEQRDPIMAARLSVGDSQRMMRAMEVVLQTGKSLSQWQKVKGMPYFPQRKIISFFLNADRQKTYDKCKIRFEIMLQNGVLEEIACFKALALDPGLPAMKAHGVPELIAYLNGSMTLQDAVDQAVLNTRHYIKRQFTWQRGQMREAILLNGEDRHIGQNELMRWINKGI